MITKDQYQTRSTPKKKSAAMTVEDVVREYGVPAHTVRYRLKTGDLTRIPTTHLAVKMTRRSVEKCAEKGFFTTKSEG